ncbi:MAG: hypothetical protein HGA80_03790 [Candidatus Omnitrophica bacterium]|nr:hypothetical protein [Candidatus Omnitrophota bacterium]
MALTCVVILNGMLAGCSSAPRRPIATERTVETGPEQLDAAQKVMGAMAGGRDVTQEDMKRVARDIRSNREAQSAMQKIVGASGSPVVKYSPVTGKHYSGDLEYDPETGAKLEVIKE